MIFSIAIIVITVAIAWAWAVRGFFSALLHLVAVVVSGAIAFAVWEPLSLLLLDRIPTSGFLSGLEGSAWAVGLLVPFSLAIAIIRPLVDRAVPSNAETDTTWSFLGGGLCGLGAGTITAGMLAIGVGTMWLGTEFMGYKRLEWDRATMTMSRTGSLWYPADEIVAGLYGALSTSTLEPGADHALARLYPSLADVPAAMRTTLADGEGRNTIRPDQFSVASVYTVGLDQQGEPLQSASLESLITDPYNQVVNTPSDPSGEPIDASGAYVAGFVTRFTGEAREKGVGIVTATPAQVRLVCRPTDGDGEWREFFPIAAVARADPQALERRREREREERGLEASGFDEDEGGDDVQYFRYLSDRSALASVPSEETPTMAFEFVVPRGYEPAAYYVKNVRVNVRGRVDQRYPTPAQRQQAIESGAIAEGGTLAFEEADNATTFTRSAERWRDHGIQAQRQLPRSLVLHSTRTGGLSLNEDNHITDGTGTIARSRLAERGVNRKLEVSQFASTPGTALLDVRVMPGSAEQEGDALNVARQPLSAAPLDEPPRLVDDQGNAYPCIGYVFSDNDTVEIRYTRSRPVGGLEELPQVPSRPNPSIEIHLLFEATEGTRIRAFAVGNRIYQRLDPPFVVE